MSMSSFRSWILFVFLLSQTAISSGSPAYVPFEAEDGVLTSPMTVMTDAQASNGQFVSAPYGSSGLATYTVDVPATSEYVIWCRIRAKNRRHDSFYVSVNGGAEKVYEAAAGQWSPDWRWTVVNNRVKKRRVKKLITRKFVMSAGTNTIVFRSREKNTGLDRLIVTDDMEFDPNRSLPPPPPQVAVSVNPQSAMLSAGDSLAFSATVTGAGDPSVIWSLSPSVGSIKSSGVYTAPATIGAQQSVTVIATSVADSSESASAVVTLQPPTVISVTLNPTVATLKASGTQAFTAAISGDPGSSVHWSLQPEVGSLSVSGLNAVYSAPSMVNSNQTIAVVATSTLDPAKEAKATVTLLTTVTLSVTPSSVLLQPADSQQFTANVNGASDPGVTWQLDRPVGTISASGLYTAPTGLSHQETVNVTATSVEDPGRSASASVTVKPPVTVLLSPAGATLFPPGSQQFTATVTGAADPSVFWQINPPVGSISANGLYTATGSVAVEQAISVIATSIEDPAKSASSPLILRPPSSESISLSLPPAVGTMGSAVSLPLSLNVFGGTAPAALQWTFEYSAAELTNVSVEVGPAAAAIGKELTCLFAATYTKCIAAGINRTEFSQGVVAIFTGTISSASSSSTRTVRVTAPLGASSNGASLPVAGYDATITVADP